ncbi:hypothetical protein MA20_48510, partial [Bradyrhizobium japonicum]
MTVFVRRADYDVFAIKTREVAAAACTVVVGNNDEFVIRFYLFAIEAQVFDPVCFCIYHFTVFIVFRRLGNIDFIGYAIDYIIVVSRECFVDERLLFCFLRIDLVKLSCRHFQPFLNLCTRYFYCSQGVW